MRKLLIITFILSFILPTSTSALTEELSAEQQAEKIYSDCNNQLPEVEETKVLKGNIADVLREQKLRQCIKNETIKIASTFIASEELNTFNQQLDKLEAAFFDTYRLLMFCHENEDKTWCQQFYQENTSLDKLLLEKNITSQILNILTSTIEAKLAI